MNTESDQFETSGRVESSGSRVDGNALAGPLGRVFSVDVTTAGLTCVGCGRQQVLAALEVYDGGPGLVARCSGCRDVMIRVATTGSSMYLDLRGTVSMRLAIPA